MSCWIREEKVLPLQVGQVLNNRSRILEEFSNGGMATVCKARDPLFARDIVIKGIQKEAFSQEVIEKVLKRFEGLD